VHGTMSMEVLGAAVRGDAARGTVDPPEEESAASGSHRKRLCTSRWASAVAWELARTLGTLRRCLKAPKNAD
jgi:hypothetical protein